MSIPLALLPVHKSGQSWGGDAVGHFLLAAWNWLAGYIFCRLNLPGVADMSQSVFDDAEKRVANSLSQKTQICEGAQGDAVAQLEQQLRTDLQRRASVYLCSP